MEHVWYVEGRGNLIIEYTPEGANGEFGRWGRERGHSSFVCITYLLLVLSGTVAFVGSHLDVVPANPETWERNPFKLVVEVGNCCSDGLFVWSCSVSRTVVTSLVEEDRHVCHESYLNAVV